MQMKTIDVNLQLPPPLIYASNNGREIRAGYFEVQNPVRGILKSNTMPRRKTKGIKFPCIAWYSLKMLWTRGTNVSF